MKKLAILVALFSVFTVSAYAADPVPVNPVSPKVQGIKEKLKPAIAKKIKPGMRVVEPGEPEEETPEEPETTEPEGAAVLEMGELSLTTDNQTCISKWMGTVTNTGTAESENLTTTTTVYYLDSNGVMQEDDNPPGAAFTAAPGVEQGFVGFVNHGTTPNMDHLVVNLKAGDTVIDSKEIALPDEGEYVFALGDHQVVNGQFSAPLTNNGSMSVAGVFVVVQGITSTEPMVTFPITTQTVSCAPVGQPQNISVPVPEQEHVGYRLMVYRTGETSGAIIMRDYIL